MFLLKKLTKYYGLAIRHTSNIDSVEKIKTAIMATYKHLTSTGENPMYEDCPESNESWCKYQVAVARGTEYKHPEPLHADVRIHILPIYEDLCNDDLLRRCLGGYTQNSNESFNSTIWRFDPKYLNSGVTTVETASYIAAILFNEGYSAILKIIKLLNLKIGLQTKNCADMHDSVRMNWQARRTLQSTKEGRPARKIQKLQKQQYFQESQGILYAPGIADQL